MHALIKLVLPSQMVLEFILKASWVHNWVIHAVERRLDMAFSRQAVPGSVSSGPLTGRMFRQNPHKMTLSLACPMAVQRKVFWGRGVNWGRLISTACIRQC